MIFNVQLLYANQESSVRHIIIIPIVSRYIACQKKNVIWSHQQELGLQTRCNKPSLAWSGLHEL